MGRTFRNLPPEQDVRYLSAGSSKVLHVVSCTVDHYRSACGRWYGKHRVLTCHSLAEFDDDRKHFKEIYKEHHLSLENAACFLIDEELKELLIRDFGFRLCEACRRY